jgi:hypothetical protein
MGRAAFEAKTAPSLVPTTSSRGATQHDPFARRKKKAPAEPLHGNRQRQ